MHQQLAVVEHRPPMREAVALADVAVCNTGHKTVGHCRTRPVVLQVVILARFPFSERSVVLPGVRCAVGREEATAVGFACRIALGRVALHRVGSHWPGLAGGLYGGQHILHRAAGCAGVVGFFGTVPFSGAKVIFVSGQVT